MEVVRSILPPAMIVIDDTWTRPDGVFSGKGGAAVLYLMAAGWELEPESVRAGEEVVGSYVVLIKET